MKKLFKQINNWILVLGFVFLWQLGSYLNIINLDIVSSPLNIFKTGLDMFLNEKLLNDIGQSLKRVGIGFIIGASLSTMLILVLHRYRPLRKPTRILLELFRPIPPIAWIPIAILWFEIGNTSSIFIVFIGAFFPVFVNGYEGLALFDEEYLQTAKSLGANKWRIIKSILLPGILPNLFTGYKIGLGMAWMSVIASELIGAQSGLGYIIQLNRLLIQTDKILVGMILIGILGYLMSKIIDFLRNIIIPYYQFLNY